MFERYTEYARRVIFFARYEASQFGSDLIEPEHFLLGLFREDPALMRRFIPGVTVDTVDTIREQIERETAPRPKGSTSVDMPLSHALKRVLAFGAEEAERMHHSHIGTEHLLLGLLREPTIASRILESHGITLEGARQRDREIGCPRGSGTAHSRGGRCRARNAAFPDRVASRRCFAARAWHAPAPADVSRTSAADSALNRHSPAADA